jgi:Transposase and inactivated derivatives
VISANVSPDPAPGRIAELEAQLARLTAERDAASARADKVQRAYERLLEHYELLKRRIFVAKAERVPHEQLELEFAETKRKLDAMAKDLDHGSEDEPASSPTPTPTPEDKPKPKGRRNLCAAEMPEERVEILDPELEGKAERIGFEVSYQLGYQRGGPRRILIARAKYKVPDTTPTEIVVTERPRQLMKKGLLAPSSIAHILVAKYLFGLPFHRQVAQLATQGVDLDDGTMCRYAEHIGASLGPLVDACAQEARRHAFCLSTDATGICIRPEPLPSKQRQACRKGHFFVILADQDHVFFEYQPRHTSAAVCDMFRGFSGYIQADAHSVYDAVFRGEARSSPGEGPPSEVACWSHARRKFWEAATVSKEPIAREALLRLRTVFDLERKWEKLSPREANLPAPEGPEAHPDGLLPVDSGVPCPGEGRPEPAEHGDRLCHPARSGPAPLSRGRQTQDHEQPLRARSAHHRRRAQELALLRLGRSRHVRANLFSLIASCKLHGLDPETYLAEVIHVMPYWPRERYLELAPRYWTTTRVRLDPIELAREIGPITVPPPEEQPAPHASLSP